MNRKIEIEVFGVKNQPSAGGCSCSGGCGPTITMGEMYKDFEFYMMNTHIKDQVEMRFIDVYFDDLDDYRYVIDAINKGLGLPLTAVNGELKFFGGISGQMMMELIMQSV